MPDDEDKDKKYLGPGLTIKKVKTETKTDASARRTSNESDKKPPVPPAGFAIFKGGAATKMTLPKIQKAPASAVTAIKTNVKGANLVKGETTTSSGGDSKMDVDSLAPPPSSGPVSYRRDRSTDSPVEKKEGVPVPGSENYLPTGILMKKTKKGLKVTWPREEDLKMVKLFVTELPEGEVSLLGRFSCAEADD